MMTTGYDISDYRAIMKEFGTMEDYDRMLDEAHKRGIPYRHGSCSKSYFRRA